MHTTTFRMTLYAQRIVAVIHYGDFFGQQFPIVREDLIGWPQLFKRWIALSTGLITIQRISIRETNYAIRWIVIYPVDSAIQRLNNWGQEIKSCRHVADSRHRRYFFAREVAREVQEVAHSSLRVRHVQRCCNLTIARKFSTIGLYSFL